MIDNTTADSTVVHDRPLQYRMSFGRPASSGAGSSDAGSRAIAGAAQYPARSDLARPPSGGSGRSGSSGGSDGTTWEVGAASPFSLAAPVVAVQAVVIDKKIASESGSKARRRWQVVRA